MRGPLQAGHIRIKLIQECALGVKSEDELAAMFGVTGPAIHYFKERHADAITNARENLDSEFAGLWIAKKVNRLAELQADVERINELLDGEPDAVAFPKLIREKRLDLHAAAEELGQLAPRDINVGTTVRYEIAGVDMDKLA